MGRRVSTAVTAIATILILLASAPSHAEKATLTRARVAELARLGPASRVAASEAAVAQAVDVALTSLAKIELLMEAGRVAQ
jgi:hypothetical protein